MSVTLIEIAKELGVSITTVHSALYGKGRISEAMRAQIINKASEMNYQSNIIAKTLSSKKKFNIAFICPNNFFYEEILNGAKAATKEQKVFGVTTDYILSDDYNPQTQIQQLNEIIGSNFYNAIAISPCHKLLLNPLINQLVEKNIPVITFNNDASTSKRICFVGENSYLAGQMPAQIYEKVLPKDANIAIMRSLVSAEGLSLRVKGFVDYLSEKNKLNVLGIYDFYDNLNDAYLVSKQILLTTNVQAIYVNSMMGTIGIARAIRELGRQNDIFMIGYDLNEEISDYIMNDIIFGTLLQSPFKQGYYSIQLLCKILNSRRESLQPNNLLLTKTQLLIKSNLTQNKEEDTGIFSRLM